MTTAEVSESKASNQTPEGQVKTPVLTHHRYIGVIASLWFTGPVTDDKSCRSGFGLEPHAAICLLTMATEEVASSVGMHWHLAHHSGGPFDRTEARIVAEYGLYSLYERGYLRLDARGKIELQEHDHTKYGLGEVQWTMTPKAARLIAPAYCTIRGLPAEYQPQAVQDILAANKAAIKNARKKTG